MPMSGHCYCGSVRFQADGEPMMRGQCYCRECQYISGGGPNNFVAVPVEGFRYTAGEPRQFARSDLAHAVTREFCPECGTSLATRRPGWPFVILKVGALDDSAAFKPDIAIQLADMQPFHNVPEGVKQFDRWPPR
jgi:hypothetical protein